MASDRTVYRVQPEQGEWKLSKDAEKVGHFKTQAEAVQEERAQARVSQPSQHLVHDHQGKIEDEATYQDDPFPPRG